MEPNQITLDLNNTLDMFKFVFYTISTCLILLTLFSIVIVPLVFYNTRDSQLTSLKFQRTNFKIVKFDSMLANNSLAKTKFQKYTVEVHSPILVTFTHKYAVGIPA